MNYIFHLSGDIINSWTEVQVNVSNSSIYLSWTTPSRGFHGVSSVEKYLILCSTIPARGIYRALWSPADNTNVTISGLRPFTNYSLIVVAILSDESRRGNTGWTQVQTEEGGKPYWCPQGWVIYRPKNAYKNTSLNRKPVRSFWQMSATERPRQFSSIK